MLRSTRALSLIVSLSVAVPFIAPALAQATSVDATAQLKKGKEQFGKKLYKDARASFAAAFEAAPSGHAAFWAGRASEELQELELAADWYGKAIAAGKLAPGEDAAARLDALIKGPVTIVFDTNPDGATVRVDGKEFGQKTPFYAHLKPGAHHIVFELGGKSIEKDVELAPLKKTRVEVEFEPRTTPKLEPTPEPAPVPTPTPVTAPTPAPEPTVTMRRTPLARRLSYITAGGAVVFLGLGALYGVKALKDDDAFAKDPTPEREDIGKRHALVSDVTLVIGAGLAITSAVLFFTSKSSETVAIAPVASPNFAGGALSIRF